MTSPKRNKEEGGGRNPTSLPSQEDDEDILDEVGAEQDEETGGFVADAERVRELGALDSESVRKNRHIARVTDKKRKGEKVSFDIEDAIGHYDALLHVWPNDKIEIRAQNLSTREQHVIKSEPRSGSDFYEILRGIHGQRDVAEYKIEFRSSLRKQYVGGARVVMPDARPVPGQQPGQPPPYYPQQPQAAPAAPQAPTFVMPSQPGADPMQVVGQVFDLFQRFQAQMAPQSQPQQPNGPSVLPPLPQTSDPAAMMNWMQQAFGIFRQMQPQPAQPVQPQPQPQQANNVPPGMPPFAPPAGTTWMYAAGPGGTPGGWFASPQPLAGVGVGTPPPRSPFQRPQYYPQGDPNEQPRGAYPGHVPRGNPRPQTAGQMFRESISAARDLFNTTQELNEMFGGGQGVSDAPSAPGDEDDDSPVRIRKVGDFSYAEHKANGDVHWAQTGVMVLPGLLKWIGEWGEKYQNARREQPQPPRRRQALPSGFVRVDESFVPPKGFVAVPVAEDELPEPPDEVPQAIDEQEEEPQQHQPWGAPVVP